MLQRPISGSQGGTARVLGAIGLTPNHDLSRFAHNGRMPVATLP
jgi:hypothetical protein